MKTISVLGLFLLHITIASLIDVLPEWTDFRSSAALSMNHVQHGRHPSVVCKRPGLTCGSDCISVYLCIETENGLYPVLSETCTNGKTCSAGACSTVPSHECSTGALYPFICNSIDGVYPDPVDCRKYNYCVPGKYSSPTEKHGGNLTHVGAACKSNYAYNPLTTYCDIPLNNGECGDYIVPVCKSPAQTGIVSGNPSVYYICLPYVDYSSILYPYLYICEHRKVYSGNYTC